MRQCKGYWLYCTHQSGLLISVSRIFMLKATSLHPNMARFRGKVVGALGYHYPFSPVGILYLGIGSLFDLYRGVRGQCKLSMALQHWGNWYLHCSEWNNSCWIIVLFYMIWLFYFIIQAYLRAIFWNVQRLLMHETHCSDLTSQRCRTQTSE